MRTRSGWARDTVEPSEDEDSPSLSESESPVVTPSPVSKRHKAERSTTTRRSAPNSDKVTKEGQKGRKTGQRKDNSNDKKKPEQRHEKHVHGVTGQTSMGEVSVGHGQTNPVIHRPIDPRILATSNYPYRSNMLYAPLHYEEPSDLALSSSGSEGGLGADVLFQRPTYPRTYGFTKLETRFMIFFRIAFGMTDSDITLRLNAKFDPDNQWTVIQVQRRLRRARLEPEMMQYWVALQRAKETGGTPVGLEEELYLEAKSWLDEETGVNG